MIAAALRVILMYALELETNARNIAGMSMGAEEFQKVIDAVQSLEAMSDARAFGDLLQG